MTTVADVELIRVDDEPGLRAWFDVVAAAAVHDRPADPAPTWQRTRAELTRPRPGSDVERWLARLDGEPAGAMTVSMPNRDNLSAAQVEIDVLPTRRRRGLGRTLLDHGVDRARAHGRTRLIFEVRRSDAGDGLMTAVGARAALHDQRRRLPLPPADPAALAVLEARAVAASAGYTLVGWTGRTPEEHLDAIAELTTLMSTDTPLDDLDWEREVHDADSVRESEASIVESGATLLVTGAVPPGGGPLVAYSVIFHRADTPWHAGQAGTLVRRAHRGHQLGVRVKLANLARLREYAPHVTAVDTWNADSNPWMVSINEAMGYRPYDAWTEWQLDLV